MLTEEADLRYEIKFRISVAEVSQLRLWREQNALVKLHPRRRVSSIYFDDEFHSSARANIAGDPFRTKYRVRWYGDSRDVVSPEIKTRHGRLVKKWVGPSRKMADFWSPNGAFERKCALSRRFPSRSSLKVQYVRDYYISGAGIRCTVDRDLTFQHPENKLITRKVSNLIIVEFKFQPEKYADARRVVDSFPIYPSRCSKYLLGLAALNKVAYL